MRYYLALLIFYAAACQPAGQQTARENPTMVYVKTGNFAECRIYRKLESGFRRVFNKFYVDRDDSFYIRTFLMREDSGGKHMESDVLVGLPRLDSATLRQDGMYLIDKNKIVCMFGNSDGGNFVELKGADAGSFKAFRNAFGGWDKDHVFSKDKTLEGIDPGRVKVYSNMENCANCDGYFKDRELFDALGKKVPGGKVPDDYLFVESSYAQVPAVQDSTEIYISQIRAEYQKINSSRLRAVDAEPQEESSEGGEVKKYYDGKVLRKIVADYMGAIARSTREYYFTGGELCFVHQTDYTYDKPMSGHVIKKEENRYYFHHGRMIRWIDEKGKIKDKKLYVDKARDILSDRDWRTTTG